MVRTLSVLPNDVDPFHRDHYAQVRKLGRDEAETLLRDNYPLVASAILNSWPPNEPPKGIALASLLGIISNRAEPVSRWKR
ncbi:hypothetical protein Pan181_41470 [Aeoliella mucimassa]|uniref:Uncharacterized protein n=1 Tax=Aeoliella mucimassa TaxID=2527972 RepID=A0A518AT53_9BACT|nr:hypothetical protein Pan181_41470 [Aeoliella mucimassa]